MTLNRVKLGHVVTFMEYIPNVASLIFQPNYLIWNYLNSQNLAELVVDKVMRSISKKN